MKKILLILLLLIIGLIITFFLNSNFRNLVINVGASTSTEEALHQLGKRTPPIIQISGAIKQYAENQNSIINSYELMILNPNKKQGIYKIEILDNPLYTHSIHNPISLEAGKKKNILFNIQTSKTNEDINKRIKEITIRATDTKNSELFIDNKVGFILKRF